MFSPPPCSPTAFFCEVAGAPAPPPEALLRLTVGVRQRNLDELEGLLLERSDPASARYGQWLSNDDVVAITAPDPAAVDAVSEWLLSAPSLRRASAADSLAVSPGGAWVTATLPVADVELLTGFSLRVFERRSNPGSTAIRAAASSSPLSTLPESVRPFVDFVSHVGSLPSASAVLHLSGAEGGNGEVTTPASLRALYGIGETEGTPGNGNVAATANFLEQYYSPDDLQQFFLREWPAGEGRTPEVTGPNNATLPGVEASLDIQYIMSVGSNVDTVFWSTAGRAPDSPDNEPFAEWLVDVSSSESPPQLFSISYADYEDEVAKDYADRVDAEFMKAGARGITLISGSGDGGVEGAQPRDCPGGKFVPTFPCSSRWETCVGGTTGGFAAGDTETAVSFTGGGFSNYYATADYQADAVKGYLASSAAGLVDDSLYNATGRGFPDVAAMAVDFQVVNGGKLVGVGGTSAATPTFAGVVALLNDVRINAGKSPLGFLNPLLYANVGAFTDVVSGTNPGCGTDGFTATEGWDPLTGLGTPIFEKLVDVVKALP